jgi:hypothetical protein
LFVGSRCLFDRAAKIVNSFSFARGGVGKNLLAPGRQWVFANSVENSTKQFVAQGAGNKSWATEFSEKQYV